MHADRGDVGKPANRVLQPDLDRVHVQDARGEFDRAVDGEPAGERAERAARRQTCLVGDHARQVDVHVGDVVAIDEIHGAQKRHGEADVDGGPRVPAIGQNPVAQPDDRAVLLEGECDVVDLVAALADVHQALLPVLDPLDRPAQRHGEMAGDEFFAVQRRLGAERAAHVLGHDDAHLAVRNVQIFGQQVAFDVRPLGGQPQGQALAWAVRGQTTPRLHRRAAGAVAAETLLDHVIGLGERGVGVPGRNVLVVEHVVAPIGVEPRGVGVQRPFGVHHYVQRLVIDLDRLQRVFQRIFIAGDDRGQRVADVFHLVDGQRPEDGRLGLARQVRRAHLGQHRPQVFDVFAGHRGHYAGQRGRLAGVDTGNPGVRVDAAHEAQHHHARQDEIGQVLSLPDEQAAVFLAFDGLADPRVRVGLRTVVRRGHGPPPRSPASASAALDRKPVLALFRRQGFHGRNGVLDRLDDVDVAGTAAQHAGHGRPDVFVRTFGVLQEFVQGHQQARRAEPALQPVLFPEPVLNRVQTVAPGKSFDGQRPAAVGLHRQQEARFDRLAVQDHRTRAAAALDRAADVRARQPGDLADEVHQQQAVIHRLDVRFVVDGDGDVALHAIPSRARAAARPSRSGTVTRMSWLR